MLLTQDQQNAYDDFYTFLLDPKEQVFVIEGFSGTGKSYLVSRLLGEIPNALKTANLLGTDLPDYEVVLTATTNKAAESLSNFVKKPVKTIFSHLNLRVSKDFKTGETSIVKNKGTTPEDEIIFIDEASFVDSDLLTNIFKYSKNCKIVFIGDPAQLAPVKADLVPVFNAGFPTARMTEIVRQAEGNPIIELGRMFREAVSTGQIHPFTPDGVHIRHVTKEQFQDEVLAEFTRPEWSHYDSKLLAWRNKTVHTYNNYINQHLHGEPEIQEGDYAIVNEYIRKGNVSLKTDQLVHVRGVNKEASAYGIPGTRFLLENGISYFRPNSIDDKKKFIKASRESGKYAKALEAEEEWIDLRPAFASTINKSQGSTYKKAYIDLDDLRACRNPDTLYRLLYVACTRPSEELILTGDLA